MISLGTKKLKPLSLGTNKISKVYLEDKLIWAAKKTEILEGTYRYDINLTKSNFFKPNTNYKFTVSDLEEYIFFYWINGKSEGKTFKSELIFNIVNCTKIAVVNKSLKQFTLKIEEV